MPDAIKLNIPQGQFITNTAKFNAFVGGYRSGKTFVGCVKQCIIAMENPGIRQGYFAPTYPHIADIYYDTIPEVAELLGIFADVNPSKRRVYILDEHGYQLSEVYCRSMEHPHKIVGFQIGHALVDEIDSMPKKKASEAWKKIIARLSMVMPGRPENTVDVTTTPEGFNFVYDTFVRDVANNEAMKQYYRIVHASTKQNAKNLPKDYIPSLLASYPAQLVNAYLDGLFVNLNTGSVYPEFSRTLNHTNAQVPPLRPTKIIRPGVPEPVQPVLHIGMDFNVGRMSAIVNIIDKDGLPSTVAEILKVRDTPAMVEKLMERYEGYQLVVYPDASGSAKKTVNSTKSDHQLLKDAGMIVRVNPANPAIRDRVTSVNAMILNAKGERRWRINTDNCPQLTQLIEKQAYDENGDPVKDNTEDPIDAAGYFLAHRYPVVRREAVAVPLRA